MVCECATQEIQYYACAHCDKQFKHVPTLLEHLKEMSIFKLNSTLFEEEKIYCYLYY